MRVRAGEKVIDDVRTEVHDGTLHVIAVAGKAARLAVDLDGSGDADLGELTAREARVLVSGSGDLDVRADERLAVAVDGSATCATTATPTSPRTSAGPATSAAPADSTCEAYADDRG